MLCIDMFQHFRYRLELWQSIKIEFLFSSSYLRHRHLKALLLIQARDYFRYRETAPCVE